jgi:hypothetical protein
MFFKQMAIVYGSAIECQSLRYAMLANTASRLPSTHFQNPFYHYKAQACRALRSKLDPLSHVDVGDLFAALVLMFTAVDDHEISWHARGCIRMLHLLSMPAHLKAASDVFIVFGPFVATFGPFGPAGQYNLELPFTVTFKQRLRYLVELCRAANIAIRNAEWTFYEALGQTLTSLAWGVLYFLPSILEDVESQQRKKISTLEHIRGVLGDPDLQKCWRDLQSSPQRENWPAVMLDMAALELAEAILKTPDMLQGLSSPPVADIARNQLSSIREMTHASRSFIVNNCLAKDPYRIILAAAALAWADMADCECLDYF